MMNFWRFAEPAGGATELSGTYHPLLVALSVAIAVTGALAMLRAVQRFSVADTFRLRTVWALSGAVSMAFGIWAMHFTGMVALILPIPMEYDVWWTTLSLLPAFVASLAAVYVLGMLEPTRATVHAGAVLLGGGIGAMHYMGMEAMRFDGTLRYDPVVFGLSLVAAYGLATVALHLLRPALGVKGRSTESWLRELGSAAILGAAVAAMHYIAMGAAHFHSSAAAGELHLHAPPFVLTGVILGMALIAGIVWLGSVLDERLATMSASLRDSEAMNRAVVTAMVDAHFVADESGRIRSVNPVATKVFGYGPEELVGQNVSIVMPEPHRHRHDAYIQRYLTTREPRVIGRGERRGLCGKRRDGTEFPVELTITEFEMNGQQFFSGTIRDLSEHATTIENTRRLRAAVDQAAEAIVILDPEFLVAYGNPAFWSLVGSTAEESLGRTLESFAWNAKHLPVLAEMREQVGKGKKWSGRLVSTRDDGSLIDEAVTTTPVLTDGRVSCYIQIRRDITAHMRMEEQLRQAQKLESIGQLSAGIAHELNTPSQYVRDNILFLKDAYAQLLGLVDGACHPRIRRIDAVCKWRSRLPTSTICARRFPMQSSSRSRG